MRLIFGIALAAMMTHGVMAAEKIGTTVEIGAGANIRGPIVVRDGAGKIILSIPFGGYIVTESSAVAPTP